MQYVLRSTTLCSHILFITIVQSLFAMIKLKLLILFLVLATISFGIFTSVSYSQTVSPTPSPDTSAKANNLQGQISDYKKKISEAQAQANTLSSQLQVMDSQIKLTELRIASNKEQSTELTDDITVASNKIGKLDSSLEKITKVLLKRIVATYQIGKVTPMDVLLTSSRVSDVMAKAKYLRIVQVNDKKLIYDTQQAKNDYQNQKSILETKKKKIDVLQKELESYNAQLDQQKEEKKSLLAVTKNSEKEYQKRLAEAMKELLQINNAAQTLISTEPRFVKKGDPIGLMGNSGFSSGAHLHFGIYNAKSLADYDYYSNHESPANSLEAKSVSWDTGCGGDSSGSTSTGTGSFPWPMETSGLVISQGYGITCWSNVYYRGKPHPAFDMYNNGSVTIRAIDDGQAYFCRNCNKDGGNGVFIFHANGKMSLYWHVQ
ncbi:hypothetical protein BH11PAT1_BH11PAT1_4000 [soil metagenome]